MGSLRAIVESAVKERGAALMGVLNLTPDSFYDGGRHDGPRRSIERVDELMASGADVIDIGPESTRPGSVPIAAGEQLKRAAATIQYAVSQGACVSVDTTLPEVARAALESGAAMVNDVSCLADDELAALCAQFGADLVIMHSRGSMTEMARFGEYDERAYDDVVQDVLREWHSARQRALARGLDTSHIWFDPGLGFHKSAAHSRELLSRLEEFQELQVPMVIGASRKSFIGALDDSPSEHRLGGSLAACLRSVDAGARMVRVHDVAETRQALLAKKAFAPRGERPSFGEAGFGPGGSRSAPREQKERHA